MGRFIIIVLDGFGVGEMPDVATVRPVDAGANTFRHIAEKVPGLALPTLEGLGLANAAGFETATIHYSPHAVFGRAMLTHDGADTFFGHQEIMGTLPQKPFMEPIKNKLEVIRQRLVAGGHQVEDYVGQHQRMLVVDGSVTVADNVECDPGLAFNVTVALDAIPFDKAVEIARLVREVSVVPRVIVFGGRGVTLANLLNAVEEHGDFIGVNAPKSGVYREDYHCVHLGYGVNAQVQVPSILGEMGIPVFLLGKVADVVANPKGTSISTVETEKVLAQTKALLEENPTGFFCTNIQETDLRGHQQDSALYAGRLTAADACIASLLKVLASDDVLVVMADHGNDPEIGHSHHTREMVPLMLHCPRKGPFNLGIRKTLADVGATAAAYFSAPAPENGTSFLGSIMGEG